MGNAESSQEEEGVGEHHHQHEDGHNHSNSQLTSNVGKLELESQEIERLAPLGSNHAAWRVLSVMKGSPCDKLGIVAYFDVLTHINGKRLDEEESTIFGLIKEGVPSTLSIFSLSTSQFRKVQVTPRKWSGIGLLGLLIKYDLLDTFSTDCIHVLQVFQGSPASNASLFPYSDYLLGTSRMIFKGWDQLDQYLETSENIKSSLMVYNSITHRVREVTIRVSSSWGGKGSLGCDVAVGYMHRLPINWMDAEKKRGVVLMEKETELRIGSVTESGLIREDGGQLMLNIAIRDQQNPPISIAIRVREPEEMSVLPQITNSFHSLQQQSNQHQHQHHHHHHGPGEDAHGHDHGPSHSHLPPSAHIQSQSSNSTSLPLPATAIMSTAVPINHQPGHNDSHGLNSSDHGHSHSHGAPSQNFNINSSSPLSNQSLSAQQDHGPSSNRAGVNSNVARPPSDHQQQIPIISPPSQQTPTRPLPTLPSQPTPTLTTTTSASTANPSFHTPSALPARPPQRVTPSPASSLSTPTTQTSGAAAYVSHHTPLSLPHSSVMQQHSSLLMSATSPLKQAIVGRSAAGKQSIYQQNPNDFT